MRPFLAVTLLLAPAMIHGQFHVITEKQILPIPDDCFSLGRFGNCGVLTPDGKSVVIGRAGRLSIRPLESMEEKEILPRGSVSGTLGDGAGFSMNGKWLYYLQRTERPGINDLWRLDFTTYHQELLIQNAGGVTTPTPQPSPDGKSIAFVRRQGLTVTGADGRNERLLDNHIDAWRSMVWSPDSSQILITLGAPFITGITKLSLVTVSTGQVTPLAAWKGLIGSVVWPSWSSGPFLSVEDLDPATVWHYRSPWDILLHGVPSTNSQIWHLRLPHEQRTQLTQAPPSYSGIFGAGPDGYSLVARRLPPTPNRWDFITRELGLAYQRDVPRTVVLELRK